MPPRRCRPAVDADRLVRGSTKPRRVVASKVAHPFGGGTAEPIWASRAGRSKQAGHTTATAPQQNRSRSPVASTGSSIHTLRLTAVTPGRGLLSNGAVHVGRRQPALLAK